MYSVILRFNFITQISNCYIIVIMLYKVVVPLMQVTFLYKLTVIIRMLYYLYVAVIIHLHTYLNNIAEVQRP